MLQMVSENLAAHSLLVWSVWGMVSVVLIVAAIIDGIKLKVPNWITFPMIISGWIASAVFFHWVGLGASLAGTFLGLALLLPAYAIGGMGAGDVKLLAGVGAWVGVSQVFWAFCISCVIGGIIAVAMVLFARKWKHHSQQFKGILTEILVVRDPEKLSQIAGDRKPTMMLLPYGIPIAIGTVGYFVVMAFSI